ncbi:glycosyltransferase, partial [bacterium]|nr:glycosyltransferase [bacterium]
DRGQSHAINKGFAKAQGEIFGWLNSDDLLLPGAIRHVVDAWQENPSAVAWVGSCHRIDPDRRILSTVIPKGLDRDSLADWWFQGCFYQPSCFFAAQAWYKVGSLDENLSFAFDLDLWLKLSSVGDFVAIPKFISVAIIHKDAKTQAQRIGMHAETIAVQIKHGYREAAIKRLVSLVERPPLNDEIKSVLKAKVRGLARRFVFWKKRQQVRYLQSSLDRLTD